MIRGMDVTKNRIIYFLDKPDDSNEAAMAKPPKCSFQRRDGCY